ncbi:Calcineurin-like phosphoesterase, partial [Globisporangium splendens]
MMQCTLRKTLLLLALAIATCSYVGTAMAEMHLMDEEEVSTLGDDEKSEMQKHEVENCVPYNIRSFSLGTRGVVEWSTRRTYIRKVHKDKDALESPWQPCSDDSHVEVRYRRIGDFGAFARQKAITYYGAQENHTTHTAWIDLPVEDVADVANFEFIVGSMFHGWSNSHRMGYTGFVRTAEEELCRPKQVHTAYGKEPGSFSVQWLTHDECKLGESQVKLEEGYHALITERTPVVSRATTTLFTDDGKKKVQRWHHVAEIKELKTNTRYTYVVGNPVYSWSIPFSTKTAPSNQEAKSSASSPMRFLVTGDIGYQNAATLPMMQSEVAEGSVDAIVSMGDYAYDLHLANGHVGDIFMEEIEPIAAAVPFMVTPGNHETHNVFSHYTERFRLMPSTTGTVISGNGKAPNNWFYSFNVGLVHFVFYSTEIYFKKTLEPGITERQEQWLREDLSRANQNRAETPWIIVLGHRPMYCTSDTRNCGKKAAFLRERLEDLFYEHGVDLYICGHQHNYERAFDVYKSATEKRTTNMRATTHILTGASGQYVLSTMRKSFELPATEWDAFRNAIFGYSRLAVHNATHLHWQQVESDPENPAAQGLYGKVVDDVWLVQEHHGSFGTPASQR